MSEIALRVEGLGKRYRIGKRQDKYKTFGEAVFSSLYKPIRAIGSLSHRNGRSETPASIWALKDVSFDINRGEVVGVVGGNGAGKSTLLKILSRITSPTEGLADIHGRVGSLLEVGTGFHPELTGRENTYLNGAILGMGRKEIDRKFDEIVAFSEIEQFIDTPVKHYSSGMYLRLAFAVAAHLDPEILLVDEVLAVGDESFQKKCLGKMDDVAKEGRTVMFVSHNLPAITALCTKLYLLDHGQLVFSGSPHDGISEYLRRIEPPATSAGLESSHRSGNGLIKFTSWSLSDQVFGQGKRVRCNQSCAFNLDFVNSSQLNRSMTVEFAIVIKDELGRPLLTGATRFLNANFGSLPESGTVVCRFDQLPLLPGVYRVHLWCSVGGERADLVENAGSFEVVPFDVYESGRIPEKKHGYFVVPHSWYLEESQPEVNAAVR